MAGRHSDVTVFEDTSLERLAANNLGMVLTLARPWVVAGLIWAAGWFAHHAWGRMPAVPWAACGLTITAVALSLFVWATSRLVIQGRAHSTATAAAALVWLTVATITGPGARVTAYLLAVCGAAFALSWNVRMFARRQAPGGAGDPGGRLTEWFRDAAPAAGLSGARLRVREIEPHRATGTIVLPPGERVADDAIKRAPNLESGMRFPPGSLTITADPDRADLAQVTISDPRVIRQPIPWPGPSAPAASIAAPLRPGLWQDGAPVAHVLPGHHVHVMGASGAGKSIGGCWNYHAEMITRRDVVNVGADITKGEQTFGPLRPALHRFETSKDGARALVHDVHALIRPRTDYLADMGLQRWREGCGLSYLVAWLEEAPDIYDVLGGKLEEAFIATAKALRSAGGTFVLSLQRSTWDQLPTIVRGQMASLCFGLLDSADERFGLSERQQEAGAVPAQWGTDHPGMAYLHAPGIPADRIAMPLRTYAWGDDDALIAAHALAYPAAARPADPITAAALGLAPAPAPASSAPARPVVTLARPAAFGAAGGQDDGPADDGGQDDAEPVDLSDPDDDPCAEYLDTPDDDPELTASCGPDDPIEPDPDDQPWEFTAAERMAPEAAREVLAEQLAEWQAAARESFAPRDLRPVMERTGMSRAWIQGRLREYLDDDNGPVWRSDDDGGGTYRLRQPVPTA